MRYNKPLFISLFLHGLAFAGTHWAAVMGGGGAKQHSPCFQPIMCVEVRWNVSSPPTDSSSKISTKSTKKLFSKTSQPFVKKINQIDSGAAENLALSNNTEANLIPCSDNPIPVYPEQARRQGLKGELMLTLTINAMGNVVKIDIEQGHNVSSLLKEAAFQAIKKWRFIRQDKSAKLLTVTLPVVFNLET